MESSVADSMNRERKPSDRYGAVADPQSGRTFRGRGSGGRASSGRTGSEARQAQANAAPPSMVDGNGFINIPEGAGDEGIHSYDPELYRKVKESVTMQRGRRVLRPACHKDKCLCPFHMDQHPSMKIYPDGKGYYCFGMWIRWGPGQVCGKIPGVNNYMQRLRAGAGLWDSH